MTQTRIHNTPLRITVEGAEDGSRLVPENTVLAVVRGMSLAKEFRVAITKREVAFNQDLKAFACKPDVDPEFLFYALFARRAHIRELATEASHGTKKLETDTLAAVELPVPKPEVQRRTVGVASAYDELIENNRRRMGLLENAARLLYQEWFVRLRFPGSHAVGSAKADGHEHTPITHGLPQGWERSRIGDIAECAGGGTPSTKVSSYWDEGEIAWVTPTDVTRSSHFVLLDTEKKITEAGLKNSSAKLVPPHTVLMTSRASVGFFAVASRDVCTNQGFISIVPHDPVFSCFLLFQLSHRVEEIRGMGSGSTFPEVSRGKFREFQVQVPPRRLVGDFDEQAALFLKQIRVLKLQNQKLRAVRDLLLPRLMSGEIAV